MERSEATFAAYDAVEITTADGTVVRAPALSVAEAARFLRLMAKVRSGDAAAHAELVATLPGRLGVASLPISSLGVTVTLPDEVACPDLTVADALAFAGVVERAGEPDGWAAQVEILDRVPSWFPDADISPSGVFSLAREFAGGVYGAMYGMADSFFGRLALIPVGQAVVEGTEEWTSGPDSTT